MGFEKVQLHASVVMGVAPKLLPSSYAGCCLGNLISCASPQTLGKADSISGRGVRVCTGGRHVV